jgi:hypothetical protein
MTIAVPLVGTLVTVNVVVVVIVFEKKLPTDKLIAVPAPRAV